MFDGDVMFSITVCNYLAQRHDKYCFLWALIVTFLENITAIFDMLFYENSIFLLSYL